MRKLTVKSIALLLFIGAFFCAGALHASAENLPIDIEIIRQQHFAGRSITDHFDIDMFNERSARLSLALTETRRIEQANRMNGLFVNAVVHQEQMDISSQIEALAAENALFAQPIDFSDFEGFAAEDAISTWIIIIVLAVFSAAGLALAFGLLARRRRKQAVVH